MKYNLAVLGLALGLAGCSSDDGLLADPAPTSEGEAIVLDVKEVASPVTRAQQTGSMTFETLKTTGFGVYGYKGAYNSASSLPTLFKVGDGVGANTKVEFIPDGTDPTTLVVHPGSWKYAETANLKEWEKNEKYTFFAYAPYVSSADFAAGGSAGINSVKTEDTAGDPTITYTVAEDPAQSVDLLWGVRTAYTSGGTTEKAGLPWIDIQQGETAAAVQFSFYHALCALGFHAQVMVDQANDPDKLGDVSSLGTIGKSDGCKVTLRKITITPANVSFHKSASLNLNNTTVNNTPAHQPLWSSTAGTIASLVLDNGTAGHGTIDSKLLDPVANTTNDDYYTPETTDLNQDGTKTDVMANNSVPGITETANTQTIIANDDLFMLIPQEAQDYTVTIEYYMTYKTTGPGYHRQSFSGTATLSSLELVAGVKYYINLVFGLTTFKVTVTANDWEETTNAVTIATETGTSASNSLAKGGR